MPKNEFRLSGRTTRRVVASLKQVLDSPGTWISLMDHVDKEDNHRALAHAVSTHLKFLAVDHDIDGAKVRVTPIRKRNRG